MYWTVLDIINLYEQNVCNSMVGDKIVQNIGNSLVRGDAQLPAAKRWQVHVVMSLHSRVTSTCEPPTVTVAVSSTSTMSSGLQIAYVFASFKVSKVGVTWKDCAIM